MLRCVVVRRVVLCREKREMREGIFTARFILEFDIACGSDALRKSGEATRRCAEVCCEVAM